MGPNAENDEHASQHVSAEVSTGEAEVAAPTLEDLLAKCHALLDDDECEYDRSLELAVQALQLDASSGEAWRLKGHSLYYLGRMEEAKVAYDQALALDPEDVEALHSQAEVLWTLDHFDEALAFCDRALKLDPMIGHAYEVKGWALYLLDRNEEALEAFEHLIGLEPEWATAWQGKGMVLLDMDRYQEAIAPLERAIDLEPEYALAWKDKGRTLWSLDRSDEALEALERALALAPEDDDASVWWAKGGVLQELNRYEEALAAYDRALILDPAYVSALEDKARALDALQRYDEALAVNERLVALEPESAHFWITLGYVDYKLERYEEAVAAYDRALALDPTDVDAWEGKANALVALDRYDEALAVSERLSALNPESVPTWTKLGYVHFRLGHYSEAVAAYDNALGIAPVSAYARTEKARSLNALKRYDDALAAVDHALALDDTAFEDDDAPDRANVLVLRGAVLRRLGRYADAMVAYDAALALQPANAYAYAGKAWVARDQHDDEAVVRYAERALDLDPTYGDAAQRRAGALYRLKRYKEALPAYELAVKLDPTEDMWRFMGMTLLHLGHEDEALAAFEQAIARMPTSSKAWVAKASALVALQRYEEALTTSDDALRAIRGNAELEEALQYLRAIVRRTIPDQRMRLRDGRWLGYLDLGDPAGIPILYCYGLPGSRLEGVDFEATLQALHLRMIAPDRPGCGLSDDQPRRTLLDWPDDVVELADHLGLERFAVLGLSGGGAYAAACAYKIPHRLTRVGLVSSAAPPDAPHYDPGANRISRAVWRTLPWPINRRVMRLGARISLADPEMTEWAQRRRYSKAHGMMRDDMRFKLPPGLRERITEPYQQGGAGYARDNYLTARPWGFRLEDISVPVLLWHGEQDTLAVPAMARYLAQAIPNCRATFYPGEGHSVLNKHTEEILAALTAPEDGRDANQRIGTS